jgi:hypothetical protein
MKMMKLYNTRLAIRNLAIATVLCLVYLVGKHLQATNNAASVSPLKIKYTSNQHMQKP